MADEKHTPGPWSYSTHSDGWSYTIHIAQADDAAYTPHWSDVAFTTCRGEREQIQEANARLIAAAPELLTVCKQLNYYGPALLAKEFDKGSLSLLKLLDDACAAIAKATGGAS